LANGSFQKMPKIVSIPIEGIPPTGMVGEKEIKFEKIGYKLNKFDPKLIIYESINERRYSFDAIIKLIKEIEKSDRKLVLHFSWPYLKGLSNFLTKIKDGKNIAVFHLGKRFCIESQKENHFEKPPSNFIQLSLEGDLWDTVYYPKNNFLDFKIILPTQMSGKNISLSDIESYDWPFDERIKDIREHLRYESIGRVEDNILKFPPVIDTFFCPSEIKMSLFLKKENRWISLPIKESVSIKATENSRAVRAFRGLCSDLEQYRDLSYELRRLFTNSTVTKKTLLQAFFIEKISKLDRIVSDSVIIANLHPHVMTQSSFAESLNYLFKSIANSINYLKLPKILNQENAVYVEKELHSGEKLKEVIWNGVLLEDKIKNIKMLFSNCKPEVAICETEKGKNIRITVKINVSVEYLGFNYQNSAINKKHFVDIVVYKSVIRDDGSFNERRISNISFERKPEKSTLIVELECRNNKNNKKNVKKDIQIRYLELSKIQALPRELITNSELLIPGPIPFHTVSEEDILISRGYDALLLPFEEIIFFAYPGTNFKQLRKQIKLYNDLVSENQNSISQRDLAFSTHHTKCTRRFKVPPKPSLDDITEESPESDTPIDTSIRQELLDDSNADEDEREEIKTLKDIWDNIRKSPPSHKPKYQSAFSWSKEQIDICVEFETGTKETLSFPVGTLIRKKHGNEYIFLSVEELSEGDQIIYIQTDERDSIENYLFKTIFSEDEMTLEDILEPLTALKLFYDSLKALDFINGYNEIKLKRLYWLSSNQKENLFNLIRVLLNRGSSDLQEVSNLLSNSVWNGRVTSEKLIEIFGEGRRTLTYKKLYNLSKELGLKYEESSFKALCSTAINEQKHYSFRDENNLLVLGKLIGHQGIVDNYHVINEKGSKIRTFLQQVGHSIKRVANGNGDPLNEMDAAIEGKMRKGKVVKMGKC
jgi:hypothetical protein